MAKKLFITAIFLFYSIGGSSELLINEFTTAAEGDWVELVLRSDSPVQRDISSLYVTMYYGGNEPLASEPVTISSINRDETPWDDRYVVVHMSGLLPDETDATGDTDGSGFLDVYCSNYSSTFWNTEGVAAIDSDDDPGNGGIIDFVAYSNRDGSPNKTMARYAEEAATAGQWVVSAAGFQESSIDIGTKGLESFMSISRRNVPDSNTANDFIVTPYQTPGKENVLEKPKGLKRLIKLKEKRFFFRRSRGGAVSISLFCREECSLRLRLFSSVGLPLHRTELLRNVPPGPCEIPLSESLLKSLPPGLCIGQVEAVAGGGAASCRASFFLVVMR